MNLLAPAALAFGLLAIPIVAMYVLKMRRPPRQVPSVFLWEQVLDDVQANAPWQRLRPNILLLLQLLALAALVLALARPFTLHAAAAPGNVVVVLDTSYRMGATDIAPSRLAQAKKRIGALVDGLGPTKVMSIVLMARRPRVLIAQSGDRTALHAALDGVSPTYESLNAADAANAMSVAAALARGRGNDAFVYTAAGDPRVTVPAALRGETAVQSIGGTLHDLGIVHLAAARASDGTVSVLANVANLGSRPAAASLRLDITTAATANPSWQQVDLHPVTLGPGKSTTIYRTTLPPDTTAVRGHLIGGDDLAADDWAWAVVPAAAPRHVLFVSPGDVLLSTALGLVPGVHVNQMMPNAYTAAQARCVDAVVFENTLPITLPAAPVFAVDPPTDARSPLGLAVQSPITASGLQAGDDPYRLLQDVSLNDVAVGTSKSLQVPAWGYAVLRTNGQPVLVAGQNGPQREAVLGFTPLDSTWGLQPGFPIAIQNLLDWLAPPAAGPTGVYRPGDPVPLSAPPCTSGFDVTDPSGAKTTISTAATAAASATVADTAAAAAGAQFFTNTDVPGLYSVAQRTSGGTRRSLFAVNVFPLPETPGTTSATGSGGSAPAGAVKTAQVPQEWAPLVAALALLALLGEWLVAARRR